MPTRKPAPPPPLPADTILDLMAHPAFFGPFFIGDTWTAWRAFLAALFALPMDDAALALYRQHTGRTEPPTAPFKQAALICGRRAGKSRVLALIATFLATWHDYAPYLAPGEVATVAVLAADRRQARAIFRYVDGMLAAVPALGGLITAQTADAITLGNRVVIEISTASFRGARGYTYAAVLADELAFWRSDDSANPDEEVLAAVRPGLTTIPGAMLLLASSPYAKRGALWNAHRKHFGQDGARMLVWRGTTLEMNPSADAQEIADAYQDDPASAAAEWGAEFRNDIAAFITREVVDACTVPDRRELPPLSDVTYLAFVDPSGGSADSMTLAIGHKEGECIVLDAVRERPPPFSPEDVVQDFAALLASYRLSSVTGDRYGGEWPRERFAVHGITYELADRPRSDLYREMLAPLNSGRVELLDLPRLTAQLVGLERRTARGGRDSIDHAPGGHDDVANAVAGVVAKLTTRLEVDHVALFASLAD